MNKERQFLQTLKKKRDKKKKKNLSVADWIVDGLLIN